MVVVIVDRVRESSLRALHEGIQLKGIVEINQTKRRIDDWQHNLNFKTRAGAGLRRFRNNVKRFTRMERAEGTILKLIEVG